MEPLSANRLGELLVEGGDITPAQLEEALEIQAKSGARLGEILVGLGAINYLTLYARLSTILKIPFINLETEPCDASLLEAGCERSYLETQMIPWRRKGRALVMAVTEPTSENVARAREIFGASVEWALTTPYDIYQQVQQHFHHDLSDHAVHHLWRFNPERSARRLFLARRQQTRLPVVFAVVSLLTLLYAQMMFAFLSVINGLYLTALLFKFYLFWAGYFYKRRPPSPALSDAELPVYTILIPIYKEKESTIKMLIAAIRAIDYPKEKLDVKLIVEADDDKSLVAILNRQPERIFHIVRVPPSEPRTKPKACNYALQFAKGSLATIYDAEDQPDPQQLRLAAARFAEAGEQLACLQARLNYYNRRDNMLTRLFSLEYAMWFDAMLFGLERFRLPMPLGGTSNHFRTRILKSIYAWDPYNVTEDADLGIRLAEAGYETQILDSLTLEEAPNGLPNWIRQRTRWIKGYIQTFFVHMRDPERTLRTLGLRGLLGFVLFIGSSSFAFIITPLIISASVLAYFHIYTMPEWLYNLMLTNLLGGWMVHLAVALAIIHKRNWRDSLIALPLFPFYWLLHSVASIRAVYQLFKGQNHQWEKTTHGVFKTIER